MSPDILSVVPFPDELAGSIVGRIAFANCCDPDLVIPSFRKLLLLPLNISPVVVMAKVLGIDNDTLVAQHTMQPVYGAIERKADATKALIEAIEKKSPALMDIKRIDRHNFCGREKVKSMEWWLWPSVFTLPRWHGYGVQRHTNLEDRK